MTCRELIEFLDAYLNGELTAAERSDFERHLQVCKSCVTYLDTYERTVAMGQAAFASLDEDVPVEVPEDLVQAILASRDRAR